MQARRLLMEELERRQVLTAITLIAPPANMHAAPVSAAIRAEFDQPLLAASVNADTLAVQGLQTGRRLPSDGVWETSDQGLEFSGSVDAIVARTSPFLAGETVQVTSTTGINSSSGAAADKFVWQFTTATSGGTGQFGDSLQRFGGGSDLSLGDLDADGDLDAWLVRGGFPGEPDRILLQDPSGQFQVVTELPTSSQAVALGDLDGDGDLDAFVGEQAADRVWLNDGNGSFLDSGQRLGSGPSLHLGLADFDGDGDLDAVTSQSIWLNDGTGSFAAGQSLNTAEDIGIGDLDNDGDLDILIGDRLWINNGNALFQGRSAGHAFGIFSLGDVDNDGDLDVVSGGTAGSGVWLNDKLAFREFEAGFAQVTLDFGYGVRAIELGDLDGDGDLDGVVGMGYQGIDTIIPSPDQVLLNDGSGRFTLVSSQLSSQFTRGLALGDVDADGDLDVVTDQGSWLNADVAADLSISIDGDAQRTEPGSLLRYVVTAANSGPEDVAQAIIDIAFANLGAVDWTCTAADGAVCGANVNGGTGITAVTNIPAGSTVTYRISGIVASNADRAAVIASITAAASRQDINTANNFATHQAFVLPITTDPAPNSLAIPRSGPIVLDFATTINGDTVVADGVILRGEFTGGITISAADVSVVGATVRIQPPVALMAGEVVYATSTKAVKSTSGSPREKLVWQFQTASVGGGEFGALETLTAEARFRAAGDLDGDGDADLLMSGGGLPNEVWFNDGTGHFTRSGSPFGSNGLASTLADVDQDGDLDAFLSSLSSTQEETQLWLNDGSGQFEATETVFAAFALILHDFNGDGHVDVWTHDQVWLGDGTARFEPNGQQAQNVLAAGDLDGDGDVDLLSKNQVYLNNGKGEFLARATFRSSLFELGVLDVELGDVDGDGDLDALVTSSDFRSFPLVNTLSLWRNDGTGTFLDESPLGTNSAIMLRDFPADELDLADVDGDGDLDAITSGQGLVTWINDGDGSFTPQDRGVAVSGLLTVDIDGDLDIDLVGREGIRRQVNVSPTPVRGDANGDRMVDFADFLILAGEFGKDPAEGPFRADFNGDARVTLVDFLLLASNFGVSQEE